MSSRDTSLDEAERRLRVYDVRGALVPGADVACDWASRCRRGWVTRAAVAALVFSLATAIGPPGSTGRAVAADAAATVIARYRTRIPELMTEQGIPGLAVALVDAGVPDFDAKDPETESLVRHRLAEVEPGLFPTDNGETLDLRERVPTWRNLRLVRVSGGPSHGNGGSWWQPRSLPSRG